MKVEVSYNSYLIRKFTKTSSEEVYLKENARIADLLDYLGSKYGPSFMERILDKDGKELKMLLLVNGAKAEGSKVALSDNDRLNILSFTTGG